MDDDFVVEQIVGKRISAGVKEDGHRKGTVLYRVIFEGWPADLVWWEPAVNINDDDIAAYEAAMAEQEAADADADEESDDEDDGANNEDDGANDGADGGAAADYATADEAASAQAPAAAEQEQGSDEEDAEDAEDEDEILEVTQILGHHVWRGAKAGSLFNVYVRVQYSDGSTTGRGTVPSEPLAGSKVLAAYLATAHGAKIAKYVPS